MKIEIQKEWFDANIVMRNLNNIYVFGDNLQRVGNGGQAQIRPCTNTRGVATKRYPQMLNDSFFSDDLSELIELTKDIRSLNILHKDRRNDHKTLIFPYDGLGTGLSELSLRSPFINQQLGLMLKFYFNIDTNDGGQLSINEPL